MNTDRELMQQALEALHWLTTADEIDEPPINATIVALRERLAQPEQPSVPWSAALEAVWGEPEQEPEFVTHNVDKPYDWSEWVCPNPSGYLMKCCDCGLVHEAEFGVVRYKSETEREDCDMVDDPNLQAVFRMRRSEEWSPKDTAYRPGGLAQPAVQQGHEQEPVAWGVFHFGGKRDRKLYSHCDTKEQAIAYIADRHQSDDTNTFRAAPLYTTPPQRKPLSDEEFQKICTRLSRQGGWDGDGWDLALKEAIEAAHGIWPENSDCYGPDWTDRDGEYLK